MRTSLFVVLLSVLFVSRGFGSAGNLVCDSLFATSFGQIENFGVKIKPKFTRKFLESVKSELSPKNPKFEIAPRWYAEARIIPGYSEPQIVAVKYTRGNGGNIAELVDETNALYHMHEIFEDLGLLQYFDVMVPIQLGKDFAIFPFVEAQSFGELMGEALARNPKFEPEKERYHYYYSNHSTEPPLTRSSAVPPMEDVSSSGHGSKSET